MSAAAAAAKTADAAPADDIAVPARGKKKLIILIAVALSVVLAAAGGGLWFVKHRAAAEAASDEDGQPIAEASAKKPHAPPTFVALEPFVVNLADKDAERYAQIGITLELDDPKVADEMKVYLPAIRDAILMILAHKTSAELLTRAGKEALAAEIMRESVRPMGIDPGPAAADSPVQRVLFSSFIIQ